MMNPIRKLVRTGVIITRGAHYPENANTSQLRGYTRTMLQRIINFHLGG
jgi:hypothetical protein